MPIDHDGVFWDPEESHFYAMALRAFLRDQKFVRAERHELVELGVGSGRPMLEVLLDRDLDVKVTGYDISERAVAYAQKLAAEHNVRDRYEVCLGNFFMHSPSSYAIAVSNPPYIPAPNSDGLSMPELWAGVEGTNFTTGLINGKYNRLIVILSGYSNPLAVIEYAAQRGYSVANFMIKTIQLGPWSREDKVFNHIKMLAAQGKAFLQGDRYCLAAVAWTRSPSSSDLSSALVRAIQSTNGERDLIALPSDLIRAE